MPAFVFEFFDSFFESGLKFSDLPGKQLWEAQKDRCINAAFAQVVNNFLNIRGQVFIIRGFYN